MIRDLDVLSSRVAAKWILLLVLGFVSLGLLHIHRSLERAQAEKHLVCLSVWSKSKAHLGTGGYARRYYQMPGSAKTTIPLALGAGLVDRGIPSRPSRKYTPLLFVCC